MICKSLSPDILYFYITLYETHFSTRLGYAYTRAHLPIASPSALPALKLDVGPVREKTPVRLSHDNLLHHVRTLSTHSSLSPTFYKTLHHRTDHVRYLLLAPRHTNSITTPTHDLLITQQILSQTPNHSPLESLGTTKYGSLGTTDNCTWQEHRPTIIY